MKSLEEINEKISRREAVVLTAEEFKQMIRDGETVTSESVDVVTTATCAIMSGTAAILSIPVAERDEFERAEWVWLNGVPAYPGPCPNERLGIVDVIVYGTTHAATNREYGGGNLFREIVEGKEIEVRVKTNDNRIIERSVRKDDIEFARIITTRSTFKNYMGFVNTKEGEIETIFSVTKLKGPYKEVSVSGCGAINPLENDPQLRTIGVGTRILVNGAIGYVMGEGTRSSTEKPNLSVFADMYEMDGEFMGGFITSKGPECITSIAVPIPVIDEGILAGLKILDGDVKMPIADVSKRVPFTTSNYAKVWHETDREIYFDAEKCSHHEVCNVERYCPTKAFSSLRGIDEDRCFNCCTCVPLCPADAFTGNCGKIEIEIEISEASDPISIARPVSISIPITLRQSNRKKANQLTEKLKKLIEEKEFFLTSPHSPEDC